MKFFYYLCICKLTLGRMSFFRVGLQTYWKDVYTAFCSDVMKLRNFLIDVMNLTTIDVLWDVSIHVVPYLLWCIFGAYNVIIITYISVGFALLFRHQGQCEGLITWNGNSRIPRFFCAVLWGFWVIFEVDFVAFFSKIRRIIMILDGLLEC